MKSIIRKFAALTLTAGLTCSIQSHAGVIGHLSYDAGDGPNIINTSTGVEYLNLSDAKNLNYAQTVAATSSGGIFEEYHIAEQVEAFEFFNAMIPSLFPAVDVTGSPDNIFRSIAPFADGVFGENSTNTEDRMFFHNEFGMAGQLRLSTHTNPYIEIRDLYSPIWATDDFSQTGFRSGSPVSWLLVSDAGPAQIPTSSPLSLMVLGCLGLGAIRRKSGSR